MAGSGSTRTLGIDGTRLTLDGQPFALQGLSFFNALYNPTFNRSDDDQLTWLRAFKQNGVNALRVWCQWDFAPPRTYVDVAPDHTMYTEHGDVRDEHCATLVRLIEATDRLGMALEVTLFSHEKQPNLPPEAQERGARQIAERLMPYHNLVLQIWNEDSTEVARFDQVVKSVDPARLVTNSPGISNVLGDEAQNTMLDLLTPHTVRREQPRFWEVAPRQIASLLAQYQKPVIDDEPARTGIRQFGGIKGGTTPGQHIAQIKAVRAAGSYHIYHHDMFQRSYGDPATPPSGLPDPDFSPFHRQVFDFLRDNTEW